MPKKTTINIINTTKNQKPNEVRFILQLFVTGILPNSARAITNIRAICESYLQDRYELDIIDIYQQPHLALLEDIIAVPLLIKKFPLPQVKLIGDLSNTALVLVTLNLGGDG